MHSVGVALLLIATNVAFAAAQGGSDNGSHSFGVAGSIVSDPPSWFSNAICPDEHPTRYQINAAAVVGGALILRAAASRHSHDPALCLNGLIPPIPGTGPYTARGSQPGPDITGYPYWAWEAHVGLQTYWQEALLGRVTIGSVWIPSKDLAGFVATLGTGLRVPRTPLVASLTFEKLFFAIPYVETVVDYFDGEIRDVRVTPHTDRVAPSVWTLGLEWWW